MKKICGFLLCMLFISTSFTAFAAQGAVETVDSLTLAEGQTQVVLPITVSADKPYAGAEFALRCGDGVTVKSISYSSKNISAAAPTQAGGYIWFSYFDGENSFSGDITVSVTLQYSGKKNATVVLHTVSLYTKAGVAVEKETLQLEKQIELRLGGTSASTTEKPEETIKPSDSTTEPETSLSGTTAPAGNETTVPESTAVTTAGNHTTTTSANSIPDTGDSSGHTAAIAGICFGAALILVLGYVIYKTKGMKKEG